MKFVKTFFKVTAVTLAFGAAIIFGMLIYLNNVIADEYKVVSGDELKIDTKIPITAVYNGTKMSGSGITQPIGSSIDVELKILGVIPVSTAQVEVIDKRYVAVLGDVFGIRLYTEGVLVIDVTNVDTAKGNLSPAKNAGIKKGDVILTINGKNVTTNEQVSEIIENSYGNELTVVAVRDNTKFTVKICPELSVSSGEYRAGLWVRDSSAGIGTLTFYSPATNIICGLGHGVCDSDTGTLLPLNTGQLVGAEIVALQKGAAGAPGELKGRFTANLIASLDYNCDKGVYGELECNLNVSSLTQIALKQEIINGAAQIICTVDDGGPKAYSCTIKKINMAQDNSVQNLMITVTDEQLINKTGGIVQGMSGSPIIQNGKLVGAITHVLIDDSKVGYGIFAENMLETAQSVAEQELKEAS